MKRALTFGLTMALVSVGLWLSSGLGMTQLWMFGGGLVGLVGIATESFLEQPPFPESRGRYHPFTLWIAPGLLVFSGLWLMQVMAPDSHLVVIATMAALAGVLLAGLQIGSQAGRQFQRLGRFAANLVVYLVVFLLFALIYHTKESSIVTATSIGLIALLAALEVFRSARGRRAPDWRWAALVGLIVAETTWAVNYWPVSGLIGGALLLLTFYVVTGLLLAMEESILDRRMLAEYGVVGVAGILTIAWAML